MVDFYLLDTDTYIYLAGGNASVLKKIEEVGEDKIALTSISAAELYYGAYRSAKLKDNLLHLETVLAETPIKVFDFRAARIFGRIKNLLKKNGFNSADFDLAIAGIALANQACLVTNNLKDFSHIPDLVLENWVR